MSTFARWGLAVVVFAGLVVDTWTHFDVAHLYDFNSTGTINEGVLFRVEGVLAILVGVWILLRPDWLSSGVSALVAGGGAVLLVLYRYVDVGEIGPIPNMHEPIWYREKVISLIGELVAFVAALALFALDVAARRRAARRQPVSAAP